MPFSRVLIVHSFNDRSFESKLEQIASNPALDGLSMSHCCIIDRDRPGTRCGELDALADQQAETNDLLAEIIKTEVAPLLDRMITEGDIEVVILHGGTVFTAVTGAILTVLIALMDKHPSVRFALERKSDWLTWRVEFTRGLAGSIHQRTAIAQNKWVSANFVEDDEINRIISEVF